MVHHESGIDMGNDIEGVINQPLLKLVWITIYVRHGIKMDSFIEMGINQPTLRVTGHNIGINMDCDIVITTDQLIFVKICTVQHTYGIGMGNDTGMVINLLICENMLMVHRKNGGLMDNPIAKMGNQLLFGSTIQKNGGSMVSRDHPQCDTGDTPVNPHQKWGTPPSETGGMGVSPRETACSKI
jgi:hypothetical protein